MIISRKEFHHRNIGGRFDEIRTEIIDVDVAELVEELKADAPFRNHVYMFDGSDLSKLGLMEETVGIKNRFPDIKTEEERMKHIEEEVVSGIYEPVPVSRDIDNPRDFYIEDGFHRIMSAQKLGLKTIRCKVRYGKFVLSDAIWFGDLIRLLGMLENLFSDITSIKELKEFLEKVVKKKPELADTFSIGY